MDFGIIYYNNNNSTTIKYSTTAQAACITAFNYMQLHSDIQQATVFDTNTDEVIRVYSRQVF